MMTDTVHVESAGLSLAVRQRLCPDRPPVLLLHGLGADATNTWEATGWFRALDAAGFGWIAPDLRGHGGSDKPRDPRSYPLRYLVDDAVAVLDAADVAIAHVIGYSLGARIAVEIAAIEPGRVDRLVLGGFGIGSGDAAHVDRLLQHLPAGTDRAAVTACAQGVSAAPEPVMTGVSSPVLLVSGDADEFAGDIETMAARFEHASSERLPGRNHLTALVASAFKTLALDFLDAEC
jgi:pimeloyl-ACP methyl ester carboxylesterase